jgi:hypothetical protein
LKGQSQVEYQEAATAAEIDATNALDKDRVPRIYRKAVRNYFDRLGDRFKPAADGDTKETKPQGTDEKESAEEAKTTDEETK